MSTQKPSNYRFVTRNDSLETSRLLTKKNPNASLTPCECVQYNFFIFAKYVTNTGARKKVHKTFPIFVKFP